MKIAFIGGGNMANAIIGGLLQQGASPGDLRVAEIDPDARERIAATLGVTAVASGAEAAQGAACVILAVKPQQMRPAVAAVSAACTGAIVVSIAAGIRTVDLSRWLGGHDRIVRVMPNTPALIRAGISAAFALPGVTDPDRKAVHALLAAVGQVLWVEDEGKLDAVTALSGSGPAYAFYLIEAMQEAARKLGFDAAAARTLSVHTVLGAAKLAEASPETAAVLRERVTSKGGTTQRALEVLESRGAKAAFVEAIEAAAVRSRELGDAFGKD
jgi:pyrroline-5-carboxylate reductase